MKTPVLTSERDLYEFLKKFVCNNPSAVQLDGTAIRKGNRKPAAYLEFQEGRRRYSLAGDTTRQAIDRFIDIFETQVGLGAILVPNPESKDPNHPSLLIKGSTAPSGWYCYEIVPGAHQDAA